jgi:DNA-binding LytR/AlgR family response regulator
MLKCIIVDDQLSALQILKNYIRKISFLELTGAFKNSRDALSSLKNNPTDLIFLDIGKNRKENLPSISIFQNHAMVVLISSNGKHALDGFEHNVTDFLLKPFLLERFYKVAEKAYKLKFHSDRRKSESNIKLLKGGFIFIKEATRLLRVELDDIYYVMGLKNYVSILTKTQRIVSLQTMKQMEELLPSHRFIRVHRSYFIAIDKIISVEKQQIQVKDKVIPIGSVYLVPFMKKLTKISNS